MSLEEFFTMGKHGLYVWSSYGMTLAMIIALLIGFSWYKKKLIKNIMNQSKQTQEKARVVKTEQIKS